jgi:hypothetical protein
MANNSFIAVPKDLDDKVALRRFLEATVTEINNLREQVATLEAEVEALKTS